jgi:chitin disaccharide deacetylase
MEMKTLRSEDKFVVFAADDLGRSKSANDAIFDAHNEGILTAASLMAGGGAFQEAASIVRECKALAIGLHLTLCDGKAVLPHSSIPDITGADGYFAGGPAAVWIRLGNDKILRQAELEIDAQFDMLEAAGISPCYVDSHHHLHMHPGLFRLTCRIAAGRGVRWIRIPNEPLTIVLRLRSHQRGLMPFVEKAVFGMLKASSMKTAEKYGLRCARNVYGLSRSGGLDESYLLSLIELMADSQGPFVKEIFCHPDTATGAGLKELGALKSRTVLAKLDSFSIKRIGYQDVY